MQIFNPLQYVAIDLANHVGLDKKLWQERIQWVKDNIDCLEDLVPTDPKTKYLYLKALQVFRNPSQPTGFIMALDSTNSGAQIMAVLGKCGVSARTCNVVNTGNREDLYGNIMNQIGTVNISRQDVKEAIVPMMYGSKAKPKELFGEGTPELEAFLQAVEKTVPILGEMRSLAKYCWNPEAIEHSWVMPDGHHVVLPSTVIQKIRVEILGTSYTYQWEEIGPDENSTPLLAHIVHAVDGYVAREMVRRANEAGFQLAHIHDSMWCAPKYMNQVRQFYKDILIQLAQSYLLEDIVSQLVGEPTKLTYTHPDLWREMEDAEYMLS